jgi:V/A-type H+-transporting ATPase subunit D
MTAGTRAAPTRQNLLACRHRLERVDKGADLLRRKREALVVELLRVARPAASARASIARRAGRAYPALLRALSREGLLGLHALGWPSRDYRVELRSGQVWGVPLAEILRRPPVMRTFEARGVPAVSTSGAAIEATVAFEELAEALLEAANRETLLRRLGEALATTSRQVNTLERRLGPALRADLTRIRQTLEEREREEHLRLERRLRSRRQPAGADSGGV